MEAAFWAGTRLDNFMFNHINITSCEAFIGVCVIAAAIAIGFEGCRTVRDWLYLEFLKKRSCHKTRKVDTPMVLKPLPQTNGESKNCKANSNGTNANPGTNNDKDTSENSGNNSLRTSPPSAPVPVIATGTIHGSGKNCHKSAFHVGLLELSLSTLLHMCQVVLGYILMLMVMTFNVWIFVAVLVGTSTGFFMFDSFNKKIHALKLNDNATATTASKVGLQ